MQTIDLNFYWTGQQVYKVSIFQISPNFLNFFKYFLCDFFFKAIPFLFFVFSFLFACDPHALEKFETAWSPNLHNWFVQSKPLGKNKQKAAKRICAVFLAKSFDKRSAGIRASGLRPDPIANERNLAASLDG